MIELPQALHDAMMRADYATFIAQVMATLEPGTRYEHNWHIDAIAHRLDAVQNGTCTRLMINLPPRSMKTIQVSIGFSAWLLGHDPTRRIICVAYNMEVAKEQAVQFNRVVNSAWFRRVFPECRPVVPNRTMEWKTSTGGYRLATSIDGSVLGRGGDYIILDDPNKGQEIYSKVARDKVKNAYDHTISTRLNHPKESAIICVMQRLHDDDLAGHMLRQEDFEVLQVPVMAMEDETWDLGHGEVYHRAEGELLQPSRMGEAEIARQRRKMGNTAFNAQYQQQPVPDDGIVIRKAWLRYYDEPSDEYILRLASWDTASTLSEDADYSVGTVWGLIDREIHLLHVERVRLEAPELTQLIEQVHRRHKIDTTLVEDGDFGRGIAQNLRRSSQYCFPVINKPMMDKLARMQARSVLFETGKVFLPRQASWLATYLDELLGFPNRRHDDQVDSTSQALDWFQLRFSSDITPEVRQYQSKRPAGRRRPPGRKRPE
jgi:predicted phage terminase large subunit-like protein